VIINIHIEGIGTAQARLMRTPNTITRHAVKRVAQKVMEWGKNRVKNQTDLNNQAWTRRKSGQRKKMLVKTGRLLKIVSATDDMAEVGWANRLTATIAAKHQFGSTETFDKSQFRDGRDGIQQSLNAPATRIQAKELLKAGYKVKRSNGRGHITPTIAWIASNLSIGKAGVILRALQGTKSKWQIVLPPRSFLGVNDADITSLSELVTNEFMGQL
jgi:phage gpG-like protein